MNEEKKSEVPSGAFKNWYGFGVKKLDYQGPFYHATKSEESLKNILVEGGVQPKNREASYVSQKPENFGVYVLVFHDNLRLHKDESPRAYKSLSETENGAWVGFCGRLPTNDKYLAGIVLNKTFADKLLLTEGAKVNEEARANLQEKVQLWTGREIIVELDTHLTELDPEKLRQNNHS